MRIRHIFWALVVAVLATLASAGMAAAAVADEMPGKAPVGFTVSLSQAGVNIIIGLVLPFLLGVALRDSNPQWVKTLGGVLVAGIATLITQAIRDDGTAVISWDMFLNFATIYATQVLTYAHLWAPIGESTPAGSFNRALGPGFVPIERRGAHSAAA